MKAWRHLGLVETIYEEEHEDSSTSTPSLSLSISSPPTPLHARVEAWALATGCETDVLIHVQGLCFQLHKDPLASGSAYLKRELTGVAELTLSPPLNITAETFTLVIDFCYGSNPVITPFNVGALRTAASLLEMTETNEDGVENLQQLAETYFCSAVAVNREYASIIFRSCLQLLPEAEETALLVSRCIEALSSMENGDAFLSSVDDVKTVGIEDFQVVADSMHCRLTRSHDILYKIVDLYVKEHNEKMSEEQKNRICNAVNCNKLSPELLMHVVQNPRMPLRFIIRAMLVEQFNTRSIFSTTAQQQPPPLPHPRHHVRGDRGSITLGGILQRDAALRQVAQLKDIMGATVTRIKSLEEDLTAMKKTLEESEKQVNALGSVRSASFRLSSTNKIERGERGSISSASFRFRLKGETTVDGVLSPLSEGLFNETPTPRTKKNLGARLMKGLKSAFRVSTNTSASKGNNIDGKTSSGMDGDGSGDDEEVGNEQVIVMKESPPSHRRSSSLV